MLTLMYAMLIFFVLILIIRNVRNKHTSWINSLNLFYINFLAYFLIMPFLILSFDTYSIYMIYDPKLLIFKLGMYTTLFFIFVLLGHKIFSVSIKKNTLTPNIYLNKSAINYKNDIFLFLFFSFIIAYCFLNFFSEGLNYYLENINNRIFLSQGKGYLLWGVTLFAPLSMYYLDKYLVTRQKIILFFFIITLVLGNFIYIFLGFRGRSLILIITLLLIYAARKKTSMKTLIISTSALLPIYLMLGVLREFFSGSNNMKTGFSLDFSNYINTAKQTLGVSEYLAIVLEKYTDFNNYLLGETFFALLTFPIPSQFFPSKPYGSGPIISNIISPGVYTLGGEYNTGFTLSLIGEAFINFGIFGIVIVAVLYGFALKALDVLIKRKSIYLPVYFVLLVGLTNKILVGEFLGSASGVLFEVVPLIIAIKFGYKIRSSVSAEKN